MVRPPSMPVGDAELVGGRVLGLGDGDGEVLVQVEAVRRKLILVIQF